MFAMQFGCILSPFDLRDFKIKAAATALPDTYTCPIDVKVKSQGSVGSCVAHAVSSILEYHTNAAVSLSTNFLYGIQKKLFNRDGKGMILRDACKIAVEYGDMLLEDCPGNVEVPKCHGIAAEAFEDKDKLERAITYHISNYFLCSNAEEIKQALVNHGPVLASMKWYNNYKTDKNGVLYGDQSGSYNYHAIMVYGYTPEGFWCQNSWGKTWGKGGKFFVPNNIKFNEARGFVDCDGCGTHDDIHVPKRNWLFDIFYKGINVLVNIVYKLIYKN